MFNKNVEGRLKCYCKQRTQTLSNWKVDKDENLAFEMLSKKVHVALL